jgi:hypothetical protein
MIGGLNAAIQKAYLLANKNKTYIVKPVNANDLQVLVPAVAPDSINSVIVLEVNEKMNADSIRYLAPNIKTHRLLAFDATLHGKGLSFGDGKAGRYYVENWTNPDQYLSWKFRTAAPASFKIDITYILPENGGGSFQLQCGSQTVDFIPADKKRNQVITETIHTISLPAGIHEIQIKPVTAAKQELIKLLEIKLTASGIK